MNISEIEVAWRDGKAQITCLTTTGRWPAQNSDIWQHVWSQWACSAVEWTTGKPKAPPCYHAAPGCIGRHRCWHGFPFLAWPATALSRCTCFLQPGFSSVHSLPAVYLGVGTTGRRKRFIKSNRHKPPFFCLLIWLDWHNLSLEVLPAQNSPLLQSFSRLLWCCLFKKEILSLFFDNR